MAKTAQEIPNKLFYKIGEVCEITDTQPYVLRFWESEFPQLAPRKNRSGQRVYQRKDIDTVLRIKRLLYEEEYTIAGARKKLEEEPANGGGEPARIAVPGAGGEKELKARPPSRHAQGELDHPVDLLAARIEKQAGRAGAAGGGSDPEREGRLEGALGALKQQLKEVLALLRSE